VTTKHDDQLAQDLVALVEHDPTLASQMLRILSDRGVASAGLVRSEQARIALAHGDKIALIQHGESGGSVTVEQGIALLVEGLSGTSVSNEVLQRATTAALPVLAKEHGKLISAIRASQDRATSVSSLARMGLAAQGAPTAAQDAIVSLGIELIGKIASTAGEQNTRKNWTLRTMRACIALQPTAIGRLVEAALAREVIYTYDLVHDEAISQLAVADEGSLRQLVNRAESSADLTAASSLVGRVEDEKLRGQYLRLLLKRYGADHEPSADTVRSVAPSLENLVQLHKSTPSAPAASHDEALLRRWANFYPDQSVQLIKHADQIGAARAPHTEQFRQLRLESERTAVAKRFVKEVIVPNKQIILLVGGSFTSGVVDAFNEFHPPSPQWGDWIFKEREQPLKHGEIDEAIGSPKCAGVVIILKPAGHMIVEQARDAAKRHKKSSISISNSSKTALRDGLRALLVHMARADNSRAANEGV
jgi:hypothetical protein